MLDSAMSLVAEKGFEAVRIADITEKAGLANGTFYNHFHDRDEILRQVAYGIAKELTLQVAEETAHFTNAADRVVASTCAMIDHCIQFPEWGMVLLSSLGVMPEIRVQVMQNLRSDLQSGIDQGVFDINLDQFFLDQFVTLIGVCISSLINKSHPDDMVPGPKQKTCVNLLRLLGTDPDLIAAQMEKHRDILR